MLVTVYQLLAPLIKFDPDRKTWRISATGLRKPHRWLTEPRLAMRPAWTARPALSFCGRNEKLGASRRLLGAWIEAGINYSPTSLAQKWKPPALGGREGLVGYSHWMSRVSASAARALCSISRSDHAGNLYQRQRVGV